MSRKSWSRSRRINCGFFIADPQPLPVFYFDSQLGEFAGIERRLQGKRTRERRGDRDYTMAINAPYWSAMMYLGTFVYATLVLGGKGSNTVCACIMGDTVTCSEHWAQKTTRTGAESHDTSEETASQPRGVCL
jgi:hypothetical protein